MKREEKPYAKGEDMSGEGKDISITKTTEIYCGRPTTGYQIVRIGMDVTFTPHLDKVYALIDEYYCSGIAGSHGEAEK
jgi:hypothetical protein